MMSMQKSMELARIKNHPAKTKLIEFCLIEEIDLGFVKPWHIRLSADDKPTIDVFPTSLKTFNLDTQRWKTLGDFNELKQFLLNQYKR